MKTHTRCAECGHRFERWHMEGYYAINSPYGWKYFCSKACYHKYLRKQVAAQP